MGYLLSSIFLKPSYSLRHQLLVGFGGTAIISIASVVVLTIFAALRAGRSVKERSRYVLKDQVFKDIRDSSRYVTEVISKKIDNIQDSSLILSEIVRDRIVGYPDLGYEDDRNVPFMDLDTGLNKYPLRSPQLPLDWNILVNVNESNLEEHLNVRATDPFYELGYSISTASASLFFQGVCDPKINDPTDHAYVYNCTEENNDFATGGAIQPTDTLWWLSQKAADLGVMMKPIYEAQPEILTIGIHMHNRGAGFSIYYPGHVRTSKTKYISSGCDWMRKINPFNGNAYGTEEEIARCHPNGTQVANREYNAMERKFCIDQALHPGKSRIFGPYKSMNIASSLVITFGRAVFDRLSGNLIACISIDITVKELQEDLKNVLIGKNDTKVALHRLDGTILAGSHIDQIFSEDLALSSDSSMIRKETLKELLEAVDTKHIIFDAFQHTQYLERLRNTSIYNGKEVVVAYPVPIPPKEYSLSYKPEYVVIRVVDSSSFSSFDEIDIRIDHNILIMITSSLCIGFLGALVVLVIVWSVSKVLTQPLNWMGRITRRIVNHNDTCAGTALHLSEDEDVLSVRPPQTEINDLVAEFRKMIQGFSGEGASTVAKATPHQIPNSMKWNNGFQQLYSGASRIQSKASNSTRGLVDEVSSEFFSDDDSSMNNDKNLDKYHSSSFNPAKAVKVNIGHLIHSPVYSSSHQLEQHLETDTDSHKTRIYSFRLFLWIVVLLVIPLILTNVIIGAIVMYGLQKPFSTLQNDVEGEFYDLAEETLRASAVLRALLAEQYLAGPIRDLHLITRMSSWLLFNGIGRSSSFTIMDAATEECKHYVPDRSCPYYSNELRTPCDCAWNDIYKNDCKSYSNSSRHMQLRFFVSQAHDADPTTGDRLRTTGYPYIDNKPSATKWWKNISDIPGAWKGANASGYETSYDRLRVNSAMAVIDFPIYNYLNNRSNRRQVLGTYNAFAADGMFTGFSGCAYANGLLAFFESSEQNKAATIGGELCPLNKFGYDPRCRDWYTTGRDLYINSATAVHVTPPDYFDVGNISRLGATSALVDPLTGEHVAQALVDFFPDDMIDSLFDTRALFPILIGSTKEFVGANTVIGPNHTIDSPPAAIWDVLFPKGRGRENSPMKNRFKKEVKERMRKGGTSTLEFLQNESDGSNQTQIVAYAPVNIRSAKALRADNFSRGINYTSEQVYSIAMVQKKEILEESIREFEAGIEDMRKFWIPIDVIFVIFITIVGAAITSSISVAITKPMIILLRIVRNINAGKFEDNIPPMHGGSREVNQVYNSFAKLNKIVTISNSAFFSGNLKWAYHFLSDALNLFRKINDQKAIAIASNNLGNTLFVMSLDNSFRKSCIKVDGECCAKAAIDHFNEALRIGNNEFDNANNENEKADFVQQLANRYFNRALFYLLARKCRCLPDNAKELGYQDLAKARDFDYDVSDFWLERKMMRKNSDVYFERLIRRLNGLVCLDKDSKCRSIWEFKSILDDADGFLFAAWQESSMPIFSCISKVARLQQLEASAIMLEACRENNREAARLGIRMLVEDEYLLDESFQAAGNALLSFMRENPHTWKLKTTGFIQNNLQKTMKYCKNGSLDVRKCVVMCLDMDCKWENDGTFAAISKNCVTLFDKYLHKDDCIGLVGFGDSAKNRGVCKKRKMEIEMPRKSIKKLFYRKISTKSANSALISAVQMAIKTSTTLENETTIIYLTDASSWDIISFAATKFQLENIMIEQEPAIKLIVIGIEIRNEKVIEQCQGLCDTSRSSEYIETSPETLDSAFERIVGLVFCENNRHSEALCRGITMEKF